MSYVKVRLKSKQPQKRTSNEIIKLRFSPVHPVCFASLTIRQLHRICPCLVVYRAFRSVAQRYQQKTRTIKVIGFDHLLGCRLN